MHSSEAGMKGIIRSLYWAAVFILGLALIWCSLRLGRYERNLTSFARQEYTVTYSDLTKVKEIYAQARQQVDPSKQRQLVLEAGTGVALIEQRANAMLNIRTAGGHERRGEWVLGFAAISQEAAALNEAAYRGEVIPQARLDQLERVLQAYIASLPGPTTEGLFDVLDQYKMPNTGFWQ